jgi:Fe-S-cluster-containing hydrogenase component 2
VIESFRNRGVIVEVRNLIEIDNNECIDCGSCFSLCPVNAIRFKKDYTVDFDKEKCLGISCGLCVDACPTRAIKLIG